MSQRGTTLMELVVILAVVAILAGITVPSAAVAHRRLSAASAAHELALVLRCAQARAQERGTLVAVEVGADGSYDVLETATGGDESIRTVTEGELGARITSTYPGGVVAFGSRGWPRLPGGSATPRPGSFTVVGGGRVVLQLGGCIRCL